ncbi:MAG TPA: hypothetical protein VFT00_08115 [Nocardioides sp.]|nr:hypothetical protein [Nocardioides sp.]
MLVAGLVACSGDDDAPEPEQPAVAADVVAGLTRALDRRATAVQRGDRGAFDAGLDRSRRGFVTAQHTYLANLAQLPLARFAYTLDPASLVREGDAYSAVVNLTMQLEGYDDLPVTMPDRYRFAPAPKHPARYLLTSVTDRAWESRNNIRPQPWDDGPIHVLSGSGVLAIFDDTTIDSADGIVSSVERGIAAVAAVVPFAWSRSVVVYALSDTAFLGAVDDLPGDDPDTIDGVAFPVPSKPGGHRMAATRFALNPRMLDHPGAERDRLVRHEITHVAVGERDDEVPVWLSEGLAEWVSVRPLAPQDRLIAEDAVAAAEIGVPGLPADDTFNDADSSAHYALAWWACEYVASTFGESTLWTLLEAMGEPEADPDEVLLDQLGIDADELARKAARLIIVTFDPESLPSPSESPSRSPSSSPSAG